jgi:retinol dehydrogenase-12
MADQATTQDAPAAEPASAAQDLAGKTYIVTGANVGIGRETARALAARGAQVYLAARSQEKARNAIDEIGAQTGSTALEFLALDLADLDSVRACADAFLSTGSPLHGLINNAGLAGQRGMTKSGFELHFGTNHVGPFLLTGLLLERLRESAPARIVNVSSEAHYRVKGIDFDAVCSATKTLTGFSEYGVSKLANLLHAQHLAGLLDGSGVSTYALHPGVVASDIWRRIPWPLRSLMKRRMLTPEQGAATSLYCATSSELADESGHYYDNRKRREPSAVATPELAAELWRRSSEWVGLPA